MAISGGFLLVGLVEVAYRTCACRETASGRGLVTRQQTQERRAAARPPIPPNLENGRADAGSADP